MKTLNEYESLSDDSPVNPTGRRKVYRALEMADSKPSLSKTHWLGLDKAFSGVLGNAKYSMKMKPEE